ncbi:MAG: large-conductance mechanosensitive channel protein MscL [Cyclobacteriaceae bacterium]|nr:large-conductance mechanosensitive channel protein MscL [Cyclobacteriaceae bacterium]
MGLIKEFKEFAMKGNVIDMAVGIVIGLAFGRIVTSVVNDIIMPPIGLLIGGVDFNELKIILKHGSVDELGNTIEAVSINYGAFIQTAIDFTIIAFAIFMIIKGMNSLKRKEEAKPEPPPIPPKEEVLLTEIRDLLKKK